VRLETTEDLKDRNKTPVSLRTAVLVQDGDISDPIPNLESWYELSIPAERRNGRVGKLEVRLAAARTVDERRKVVTLDRIESHPCGADRMK